MGEVTVQVPDPTPPAPPAMDSSVAIAVGSIQGELTAQRSMLEQILQRQSENQDALQRLEERTAALLQNESEPEDESLEPEPEPVEIPPPLLEPPAVDPTTTEQELPEKRPLGMLHGW